MSVSGEIIKVLNALTEKLGIAVDWTADNIIPYFEKLCGKFVNYEIVTSIVWLLIGIVLLIVSMILWKHCKEYNKRSQDKEKYDWETRDGYEFAVIFLGILTICFVIIGVIMICCQIFDIVTCLTFPEKMILKEIKSIYDSMK